MTCPYLDYRRSDGDQEFDHERPYCDVVDDFVSPMRADLCNDRHDFDHAEHCEFFPDEAPPEVEDAEETESVATDVSD